MKSVVLAVLLTAMTFLSTACDRGVNPVAPTQPDPPVQAWPDGVPIITRTIEGVVTEELSSVCEVKPPATQENFCLGEIVFKITVPNPQGHGAAEWHFTWSPVEPGNELKAMFLQSDIPYITGQFGARGSAGDLHSHTFTGSPLGIPEANVEYRLQVLYNNRRTVKPVGKTHWRLELKHSQ